MLRVTTPNSCILSSCSRAGSAVFALDNAFSRFNTDSDGQSAKKLISPETVSALQQAVKVLTRQSLDAVTEDCTKLSPFLLHMLYKALMMCLSLQHRPHAELNFASTIDVLKHALERLGDRWLVAGTV